MSNVRVDPELLKNFMVEVFTKLGIPSEDARIKADVLIKADLYDIRSHGVGRLKYYYDRIKRGQHEVRTEITILKDQDATAVIDGNHGIGHVIAHKAMTMAIEKAKKYGIGAVAVRNSTHFGIAGYYSLMAVEAGCVGITVTNARPAIAPTIEILQG